MRVLVTGVKGQLGFDVVLELEKRGYEAIGVDVDEMDITDEKKVCEVLDEVKPDAVVHCAAYTAVDAAEDNEKLCRRINVDGTAYISKKCGEIGCKLVYLSTDYVFDGTGEKPWSPDDRVSPLNVYGQSKYDGEVFVRKNTDKHFIIRISWVFGVNGNNFIKTMLRLGKEKKSLSVVSDQIGSPTYTKDLSVLLVDMLETEKYGTYHATNEGVCSWYEFAVKIFEEAGLDIDVTPIASKDYPQKAQRPANSRMEKSKLVECGFNKLPSWQDALKRYIAQIR